MQRQTGNQVGQNRFKMQARLRPKACIENIHSEKKGDPVWLK
jgi:hypothetical protein